MKANVLVWGAVLLLGGCGDLLVAQPPPAPYPAPVSEPPVPRCAPIVGAIADGLPAHAERPQIEAVFGAPSHCRFDRCSWLGLGLEIAFDPKLDAASEERVCVRSVTRSAPLAVGALRVTSWSPTRERWGGVRGFGMSARYDFHAPGEGQLRTRLLLQDEHGDPVKVATPQGKHDGQCNAQHTVAWPAHQAESSSGTHFYYQLLLAPGPQRLRYALEAEFVPTGGETQPVTVEGGTASVSREQPQMRWLRLGITRIVVNGKPSLYTDTPDLLWSVRYDGVGKTSVVRDDTFDAKWQEKTPWLRVSLDDAVDVLVTDRDVQHDDQLAKLAIDAAALVAAAAEGKLVLKRNDLTITMSVEATDTAPTTGGCVP